MLKKIDETIKKQIFSYSVSGIIIVLFIFFIKDFTSVVAFLKDLFSALSPFIWGIVFSFILSSLAKKIERLMPEKWHFKLKRFLSSFLSITVLVMVVVAFAAILIPQVIDSVVSLSNSIKGYTDNMSQLIADIQNAAHLPDNVIEIIYNYASGIADSLFTFLEATLPNFINATWNTLGGVLNFIVGFVVALYILIDREKITGWFNRFLKVFLSKKYYYRTISIVYLSVEKFYNFMIGKLLDSLIVGIICFIAMSIMNLSYPLLISFIIGVTNIIPFFGPIIGAIPCTLILMINKPLEALMFVAMVVILQQIDGNIIGPYILGDTMGLSSLLIMFAIFIGGHYFGFYGMILGVPIFSILYFLLNIYIESKDKEKEH